MKIRYKTTDHVEFRKRLARKLGCDIPIDFPVKHIIANWLRHIDLPDPEDDP